MTPWLPSTPAGALMALCGVASVVRGWTGYIVDQPRLIDLEALEDLLHTPSSTWIGWIMVTFGALAIAGAWRPESRCGRAAMAALTGWAILWSSTLAITLWMGRQEPPVSLLPVLFWSMMVGALLIAAWLTRPARHVA